MSALIDAILSVRGLIAALVISAVWLSRRPHSRAARRFLVGATFAFAAASIYAVPLVVARLALTRGFHPFTAADLPAGRTAIVVLGGGAETVHGWSGGVLAVPSGDGLERVLEGARVFRLTNADSIISSGGILDPRDEPDGTIMRDQLVHLGVPASRIVVELQSRTTREQAELVTPIVHAAGAAHVVLVTSDIHMPRALGAFRALGVRAIPAIAPEPHAMDRRSTWFFPSTQGLGFSKQVVHELGGLAYYASRGWLAF